MSLETLKVRGNLGSYGPRDTSQKFGGVLGDGVIKSVSYEINYTDLASTSATAATGLDHVIPAGASILNCRYVVETAVVGPTAITCGTYRAYTDAGVLDGTTAIDVDGLMTAAVGVVTAMDAAADVVVGTGAQLTTATGGTGALAYDAVIRVLPTVAVATAGKFRVYVEYLMPAA